MGRLIRMYTLKKNDIKLFLWKNEAELDVLYNQLPSKYKTQAEQQFKSITRRKEWIATRVILKKELNKEVDISYASNGQPLLINSTKKYYISISHCENYICLALSNTFKIGVDIETIKSRIVKVQRYLHDKSISENEITRKELEKLTILWSTKEAVFKAYSDVISTICDIETEPFNNKEYGILKTYLKKNPNIEIKANYQVFDNLAIVYSLNTSNYETSL